MAGPCFHGTGVWRWAEAASPGPACAGAACGRPANHSYLDAATLLGGATAASRTPGAAGPTPPLVVHVAVPGLPAGGRVACARAAASVRQAARPPGGSPGPT